MLRSAKNDRHKALIYNAAKCNVSVESLSHSAVFDVETCEEQAIWCNIRFLDKYIGLGVNSYNNKDF